MVSRLRFMLPAGLPLVLAVGLDGSARAAPGDGPVLIGDLNGDGKADTLMWRESDHSWVVNLSSGSDFFAQRWTGAWGSDGTNHIADLNGDDKADVFMWRGDAWTVNLSTGSAFNSQMWSGAEGSDGPINVGDLNGDGKADVFMWRESDKDWTVNLSTGSGFSAQVWTGDWGSDGPINVGDLNGDGKADVFMWRGDVWTVNLSTGAGWSAAMWRGESGSDGANVGDFDGDHRADVAMFHATTANWGVNLSTGAGWTALTWPKMGTGQCKFRLPHGPAVTLDLDQVGTLAYTGDIRVINVYWGGNNWNGIPAHANFHKEDIDAATRALFGTDYFERLCQYGGPSGGPQVTLLPSVDTGQALNPCLPHVPQNNFTGVDVFQFVSCEEGLEFTDVPHAHGVPSELIPGITGLSCTLCGVTPLPCYLDGVCLLVPNSSGDLIINVFPPRDKHFSDALPQAPRLERAIGVI